MYKGTYEPIVSRELWERVQTILDDHGSSNRHRIKHDFAFSGVVRCGHCGCMLVAQVKKRRMFTTIAPATAGRAPRLTCARSGLSTASPSTSGSFPSRGRSSNGLKPTAFRPTPPNGPQKERVVKRQQDQYDRIEQRIRLLYEDRLDGRIDAGLYDSKAAEFRQQQTILRRIEDIRSTTPAPAAVDAIRLMELTSRAAELLVEQDGHEQARLLRTILKTAIGRIRAYASSSRIRLRIEALELRKPRKA